MSIDAVKKEYEEVITESMARTLWTMAFANWAEENDWPGRARNGADWDDVAPETPDAAVEAADALVELFKDGEGLRGATRTPMTELFALAMEVDRGRPYEFDTNHQENEGKMSLDDAATDLDVAGGFGGDMVMEALGTGVAWSDNHRVKRGDLEFKPAVPSFECHYDGESLSWNGRARSASGGKVEGSEGASGHGQAVGPRVPGLIYVNENDAGMLSRPGERYGWRTYLFGFRAEYLVVYAEALGDALDELIDWVHDNRPDALANEAHEEALNDALRERGIDPDEEIDWDDRAVQQADEEADAGLIGGGNYGDYVQADELYMHQENTNRDRMLAFARERGLAAPAKAKQNPTCCLGAAKGGFHSMDCKRRKKNPCGKRNPAMTNEHRAALKQLAKDAPNMMSDEAAKRLVKHINECLKSGVLSERLEGLLGLGGQ